jgi:hypothetical protein
MSVDGEIIASVPVTASLVGEVGQNIITAFVPVVFTASAFVRTPQAAGAGLSTTRQRYPAIPAEFLTPNDMASTTKVLQALRERVEIFSRDRGRTEDSFVRVDDLIDLGLIKPEDVQKLSRR